MDLAANQFANDLRVMYGKFRINVLSDFLGLFLGFCVTSLRHLPSTNIFFTRLQNI